MFKKKDTKKIFFSVVIILCLIIFLFWKTKTFNVIGASGSSSKQTVFSENPKFNHGLTQVKNIDSADPLFKKIVLLTILKFVKVNKKIMPEETENLEIVQKEMCLLLNNASNSVEIENFSSKRKFIRKMSSLKGDLLSLYGSSFNLFLMASKKFREKFANESFKSILEFMHSQFSGIMSCIIVDNENQ